MKLFALFLSRTPLFAFLILTVPLLQSCQHQQERTPSSTSIYDHVEVLGKQYVVYDNGVCKNFNKDNFYVYRPISTDEFAEFMKRGYGRGYPCDGSPKRYQYGPNKVTVINDKICWNEKEDLVHEYELVSREEFRKMTKKDRFVGSPCDIFPQYILLAGVQTAILDEKSYCQNISNQEDIAYQYRVPAKLNELKIIRKLEARKKVNSPHCEFSANDDTDTNGTQSSGVLQ